MACAVGAWTMSIGAHASLVRMALSGITLDLLANICDQLAEHLPRLSDPDMALNNFDRFIGGRAQSAVAGHAVRARSRSAADSCCKFSRPASISAICWLPIRKRTTCLRITEGQPVTREVLVDEIVRRSGGPERRAHRDDGAAPLQTPRNIADRLRRHHSRPAAGNCRRADFASGRRHCRSRRPLRPHGTGTETRRAAQAQWRAAAGSSCLRWANSAACELNYSSDIDLIFLYEADGATDGQRPQANVEFFDRLARDVVKLLTEPTDLGVAYRVDLRLRPRASTARWSPAWKARCTITMFPAAPGNGRRS